MDVQVIDGLSSMVPGIDDRPIALREPPGTCDFGCSIMEMAQQGSMLLASVRD
jgi:hypothetical protein